MIVVLSARAASSATATFVDLRKPTAVHVAGAGELLAVRDHEPRIVRGSGTPVR